MPQPMPPVRRVLYALGSSGFQITDRIVVVIAIYFYLPPAGRGLEMQLSNEVFFGVLTMFGLASLVGRVFDAVADPFVGHASDRSRSLLGRRRSFLVYGLVPMVALPVLLFWPPGAPGSVKNAVWLAAIFSLYFIFFTVYVAPYLALIPEIAWNTKERVNLSTLMAVVGIPATLFAMAWTKGLDWGVASGLTPADSMRWVVVAGSLLALVLCLLPIAVVDEKRFCHSTPAELPLRQAVRWTVANLPFRRYLVAQIPFIVGVNLIQPAAVYYATVVLGRSEGFAFHLGAALFAATLVAFLPVNRYARRAGPKRTIMACVALMSVSVSTLGFLVPDVPGGPRDALNLTVVFVAMASAGVSVAGFITMPNVLISQVIDYDTMRTGANRAAMYFGMQGFFTKMLYGVSGAILAFLFGRFGNSADEPLGVILVGPVAGAFCLASALLFLRYPEREVLAASRQQIEETRSS
jgi:GPH family glycoside/pentoside/hexuronide:cation symporter